MDKNLVIIALFICQLYFCQTVKKDCPNKISYFAYNLDGWYVPIKYEITEDLIDLKIRKKDKEELFIRFKIIKNLNCDFMDAHHCKLKYKVLTYDEETDSFENRESEIEFNFSDGKGKIYIQHPNFPLITSSATSIDKWE